MFFSVLLFVKAFYPIKMPKQEKKNFYSFRVEMRISPGKPDGKKKTLPRGKHNDFSSISSSNKRTTSEKEFWKIKGIHLGSIVGPLNVGYRFSTLV